MRRHRAHVDAVALAEFREGLIGGGRAARIQQHLAGCERCAGIEAGLTRVTALLAAVPQPVMPDGLARRVTQALAAEAAARPRLSLRDPRPRLSAAPQALNGHSRPRYAGQIRRITAPLRGRGRLAALGLASAAAACLLAAGGYALTRLGPSGSSASSAAGPIQTKAGPMVTGSGARNHPYAVPGTTPFMVVSSRTDYRPPPSHLARQVEKELAVLAFGTGQQTVHRDYNIPPGSLDSCVKRVTRGTTPTLVEFAHYEKQPADIIVYAGHVLVVEPNCTAVLARASLSSGP
jgi:hypothetical protein